RHDRRDLLQDALDLWEGGRHAPPRYRFEVAPGLDRRPAAPRRYRRAARALQQALPGVQPQEIAPASAARIVTSKSPARPPIGRQLAASAPCSSQLSPAARTGGASVPKSATVPRAQ